MLMQRNIVQTIKKGRKRRRKEGKKGEREEDRKEKKEFSFIFKHSFNLEEFQFLEGAF